MKKYLKLLRISHWVKNLFVFVPVLFAQKIFDPEYFVTVFFAFIAFSLVSSIVYIFNDIIDAEADRLHPVKKMRPIASGEVSKRKGWSLAVFLAALVIVICVFLRYKFNVILGAYLILNVVYTLKLKTIVVADIFSIATGFMLRVLAGAYVISIFVSSWLVLTTIFISLFLAVMKRRSELVLITNGTRKVLDEYNLGFIDQISAVSAACVTISYAMYTVSEHTLAEFNTDKMVYTTIFVVFGIFRYMYLVYKKSKGENAIEILVTDIPMILNIVLYVSFVVYFIYR